MDNTPPDNTPADDARERADRLHHALAALVQVADTLDYPRGLSALLDLVCEDMNRLRAALAA